MSIIDDSASKNCLPNSRKPNKAAKERVGFTRSSISRTLKELRKNGYVKMKMDKDDNRKKHIVLTPKAHAAEGIVKDYIENLNDCLVQEIPEHRLEGIESALRTILDNIQQKTPRRPV